MRGFHCFGRLGVLGGLTNARLMMGLMGVGDGVDEMGLMGMGLIDGVDRRWLMG